MSVVDQVALAAAESAAASAVTAGNAATVAVQALADLLASGGGGGGGGGGLTPSDINAGNFTLTGNWNFTGATVTGLAPGTIDYNSGVITNKPTIPTTLASIADTASRFAMTSAQVTKLAGIATSATANAADSALRDRTTHTGIEPLSAVRPGTMLTIVKDPVTGFWPSGWNSDGTVPVYTGGSTSAGVRPTARPDLKFVWQGIAPPPAVVTSGTGGARDKTGGALGDVWIQEP